MTIQVFHMRAAKRHRVCVKPCFQGFNLIYSRGTELSDATLSNEAVHQRGKHPLAMDVYLLSTVQQAVQLTWFAFMVLHDTPPKPSHRVLAAEPRVFVSFSFCSLRENHLLKTPSTLRTFHLTVLHLPSHRGN